MPRQARIDAPGAVHHVIARGIERSKIFRDDEDRDNFLKRLGDILTETQTKCFAWALIPNHFHLLLKTGNVPVATVMRRLLTGYAVSYNRRHRRSGHLFQNRYKSVLCQEDIYFKELVRYIHLNPLRAELVKDPVELDRYPYSGHSYIVGEQHNDWQSVNEVLALFENTKSSAKRCYHEFLISGIGIGRRPELVGGGLIRSAGGWSSVQSMRKAGIFQKSDERILGDGDFVESVLSDAQESKRNRYLLAANGVSFENIIKAVSDLFSIQPEEIAAASKERTIVKARILVCYWAVRELGISMTDVADLLKIAVPTVSVAVKKGMQVVRNEGLELSKILNIKI